MNTFHAFLLNDVKIYGKFMNNNATQGMRLAMYDSAKQ